MDIHNSIYGCKHRTSVDQMQSIHCPSQHTHRPVPHHWLQYKVTWPTSGNHGTVMPGDTGGLGWHPTGKNYLSEPIHAPEMPSSAWGTRFVKTIIDLVALNDLLHRAKCHNKSLFSKWWFPTDGQLNPYQIISLGSFHSYQIPRKKCEFLFLFSIHETMCNYKSPGSGQCWLNGVWHTCL